MDGSYKRSFSFLTVLLALTPYVQPAMPALKSRMKCNNCDFFHRNKDSLRLLYLDFLLLHHPLLCYNCIDTNRCNVISLTAGNPIQGGNHG